MDRRWFCSFRAFSLSCGQVEKLTQDNKKGLMKSNKSPSTESTEIFNARTRGRCKLGSGRVSRKGRRRTSGSKKIRHGLVLL